MIFKFIYYYFSLLVLFFIYLFIYLFFIFGTSFLCVWLDPWALVLNKNKQTKKKKKKKEKKKFFLLPSLSIFPPFHSIMPNEHELRLSFLYIFMYRYSVASVS